MTLLFILVFSALGSIGAVAVAAVVLIIPEKCTGRVLPVLVSYAIGTLLGAALLGMIPHAVEHLPAHTVMFSVLAGIIGFYILESFMLWRHCHEEDCQFHSAAGSLILIGDAFHNFVDGILIASAFMVSTSAGITAALAVIAHEIPQEAGDFSILLHSGYGRGKAFFYNALSSSTTIIGALLGYFMMSGIRQLAPYILCISAASFLYIALADLIPSRRQKRNLSVLAIELALITAGVLTIWLFHRH
jgi:zinc and cadmium transporter